MLLEKYRWGIGLVALAILLSFLPPVKGSGELRIPLAGYAAAFFWLLGLSVLAGVLFPLAAKVGDWLKNSAELKYACSQFRKASGRHRLTVAGLLVAIGMAAGMGILVKSFEQTLTSWIDYLLKADLYVATAGAANAENLNRISEETWRKITGYESVDGVDTLRRYTIQIEGKNTFLAGATYNENSDRRLRLIWVEEPENPHPDSLKELGPNDVVPIWVSESFTRRFGWGKGTQANVPIQGKDRQFSVLGVYADYGSETGTILMDRRITAEWFGDQAINNLAIYLKKEADAERILQRIESDFPALVTRTNSNLRSESLKVFHQTFAVTYALEAIAVFVAVAGLGMALVGLLLDRRQELVTLKEIGFTRLRIATATMWEGLGLGVIGAIGGVVLSLALGHLLVYVINRQSFGWTLSYHVPVASILGLCLLTLLTAAVVAFSVGWFGAKLKGEQEG